MESKHTIVCVDALTIRPCANNSFDILLITRKKEPNTGCYAFPGGHLEIDEDPEVAVLRELKEETSLVGKTPELFQVRGKPGRDPRGHTVSIFYCVEVDADAVPKADDDAATAKFYPISEVIQKKEQFAFDHYEVLEALVNKRLKK